MRLSELLANIGYPLIREDGGADPIIQAITNDSRQAGPGVLFGALQGRNADGADFAEAAAAQGSPVIFCRSGATLGDTGGAVILRGEDDRAGWAHIAAAFYPAQPEHVVAVTGTDGKTSTVNFYRQLVHLCGQQAASIGTLGVIGFTEQEFPKLNTSPDPAVLHHAMQALAEGGCTHLGLEASSWGIAQHRLDGVKIEAAGFTSFGRDHLDDHGTLEAYRAAKEALFLDLLPAGGTAVLCSNIGGIDELRQKCEARGQRVLTYGSHAGDDYRIVSREATPEGQVAVLGLRGREHAVTLEIFGDFQLENILAALALAEAGGLPLDDLLKALPELRGVPGRIELVGVVNDAPVFVDYAHTPDAMEKLLQTLRPHCAKDLWIVFGCGGDRDAGKRPIMGGIAARLADRQVVTDDNPRSEDASLIRKAIMAEAPEAKEMDDRAEAIAFAMQSLTKGDVLVITGKGHEEGQIVGNRVLPFSDAAVVRANLAHRGKTGG